MIEYYNVERASEAKNFILSTDSDYLMNLCNKQVRFYQQVQHRQQVHGVYLSETILNCFFGRVVKC